MPPSLKPCKYWPWIFRRVDNTSAWRHFNRTPGSANPQCYKYCMTEGKTNTVSRYTILTFAVNVNSRHTTDKSKLGGAWDSVLSVSWRLCRESWAGPGFTRFETLYVILLNIHMRLPKQRCSMVHHILQDQRKKKYCIHSLALALSLTVTFNHLANEPLQPTTMLFSLNLRQRDRL